MVFNIKIFDLNNRCIFKLKYCNEDNIVKIMH